MGKDTNSFDNRRILLQSYLSRPSKGSEDYDLKPLDKQKVDRYGQDTKHRNILVWWMIGVISIWLTGVLLFVAFNKAWCLNMSETVQVTLLATTTANVPGLPSIILRDLFGKGHRKFKNK